MDMLRENVIGTPIEAAVFEVRDRLSLIHRAISFSQSLGDTFNNQLAAILVTKIAKKGSTFIDIGAHIGSVVSAARRRSGLNVIAVAAIPEKADKLRKKFRDVTVFCCALSDKEGEASFFINLDASGYSSLNRNSARVREITVKLERLDNIIDADNVDVIKIDVEGAELGVLRGAEMLINRCRPTIMFESGPEELMGFTKDAMWQWMKDHDYVIYAPDRLAHTGQPMSLDVFLDSHSYPRRTTNYFAVHSTRIGEIRKAAISALNL
jgi:FkbM family methyltransferase